VGSFGNENSGKRFFAMPLTAAENCGGGAHSKGSREAFLALQAATMKRTREMTTTLTQMMETSTITTTASPTVATFANLCKGGTATVNDAAFLEGKCSKAPCHWPC